MFAKVVGADCSYNWCCRILRPHVLMPSEHNSGHAASLTRLFASGGQPASLTPFLLSHMLWVFSSSTWEMYTTPCLPSCWPRGSKILSNAWNTDLSGFPMALLTGSLCLPSRGTHRVVLIKWGDGVSSMWLGTDPWGRSQWLHWEPQTPHGTEPADRDISTSYAALHCPLSVHLNLEGRKGALGRPTTNKIFLFPYLGSWEQRFLEGGVDLALCKKKIEIEIKPDGDSGMYIHERIQAK